MSKCKCSKKNRCWVPRAAVKGLISNVDDETSVYDPNLRNPWGLVADGCGKTLIVANNASGTVSMTSLMGPTPFTFSVPSALLGVVGSPTGVTVNPGTSFPVSQNGISRPSSIITVSEDGIIAGYNMSLSPSAAITAVATGAKLTGVAFLGDALYVANFSGGTVDVYNGAFTLVTRLSDSGLSDIGYAPFNVRNVGGCLYVTFALRDEDNDPVEGAGHGYIDVVRKGSLVRLIERSSLNVPWGLAGDRENLYVGNNGNGLVQVYDACSGLLRGTLRDKCGNEIRMEGLWGLDFGTPRRLYSAAGIDDGINGLVSLLELQKKSKGKKHK